MNQPYPPQQPNQPYPPQPGYGYHSAPSYGTPPPQAPKKRGLGKILGLGCLGVVVLFFLVVIAAAVGGGGDDDGKGSDKSAAAQDTTNNEVQEQQADETPKKPAAEKPADAPVAITANKTAFAKTLLADGSNYTSVSITVTNNSDEQIDVNPLYFTITDTDGTKHTAELAVDENQIDTVDLAPGENISGSITGKGNFTPKYVTYTDGFLGDSIRADVS
ncbi:DUF4352 domain-containing protein [Streptomyces cadmiisoli]|uniref:DUF4352 domain-containing protein n=1 Tax=Streptomyces cadmiisoli TaxID=2184053 RepID=UPI00365D6AB1